MKLTHLVVAGAALVSFSAIAADESKQKQDSQAQSSQQGSEKQAQSGQTQAQSGQKQQASQSQSPEVVKQVQEKLSSQGYDPGPADGKMGPKTQAALKKLQEDRSLKTSGQLDQQTLATLGLDEGASASTGASGSSGSGASSGGQSGQQQPSPQQPKQPQPGEKQSSEKKY